MRKSFPATSAVKKKKNKVQIGHVGVSAIQQERHGLVADISAASRRWPTQDDYSATQWTLSWACVGRHRANVITVITALQP